MKQIIINPMKLDQSKVTLGFLKGIQQHNEKVQKHIQADANLSNIAKNTKFKTERQLRQERDKKLLEGIFG